MAAFQLCDWQKTGYSIDVFLLIPSRRPNFLLSSEVKIRRHLRQCNPDHPASSFDGSFLDNLSVDGPNDSRHCVVNEVVGAIIKEQKKQLRQIAPG